MKWTQYELYIRRRDKQLRLVTKKTGRLVTIKAVMPMDNRAFGTGLYVWPRGEAAVFLMRDEIHVVQEFPPEG